MKKTFTLLLFLVATACSAQTLINETAHWKQQSFHDLSGSPLYQSTCMEDIYIVGDSVVGQHTYYQVFRDRTCVTLEETCCDSIGNDYIDTTTNVISMQPVCLLREEGNTFRGILAGETNDRLIYDFNLELDQVANSVTLHDGCFFDSVYVESIGFVCLGSEARDIFYMSGAEYQEADAIIQGVGPSTGFFTGLCADGGPEFIRQLDLFTLNDDTLYRGDCTSPNTGIEQAEESPLLLYPNPATDIVTIQLPANGEKLVQVTVYDLRGRNVYQGYSDSRLDVSQLNAGTYLLIIETDSVKHHRLLEKR